MRDPEAVVVHNVPTTANYLRFLAFLVRGSYAPVVLMPRPLRYLKDILVLQRMYLGRKGNAEIIIAKFLSEK